MRAGFAGLCIAKTSLNLLKMPLLHVEIGAYRFLQQIAAVAIKDASERVESINLIRIDAETNGLLVHTTKAYRVLRRISMS
jgi:hypothetical protein